MGYKMPMSSPPIRTPIRILGIDPGLRRTGWGVIEIEGNRLIYLGCGSVKKTVVGAGHADKNQIMVMLKVLLPKAEPKSADAADALAIAITHAHHRGAATMRLKVVGL